jgi:dihydrodipicolinate synthase/N-acetylneuraminate lyase
MVRQKSDELKGYIVAIITPFLENEEVDYNFLRQHVRWLFDNGVHGLLPCGSSGEHQLLTWEETQKIYKICLDEAKEKNTMVAAASAPSTREAIARCRWYEDMGVDFFMVPPPSYQAKFMQPSGIQKYFHDLAEAIETPCMIYNSSFTQGFLMDSDLIVNIHKTHPKIYMYYKHADSNIVLLQNIIHKWGRDKIKLVGGLNHNALPMFHLGTKSWLASAGNVFPKETVELINAVLSGDMKKAEEIYWQLWPFFIALYVPTVRWPEMLKEALHLLGFPIKPVVRRPRSPLNKIEREGLRKLLQDLGKL